MGNIPPVEIKKAHGLPLWVIISSLIVLIGFLVLIVLALLNSNLKPLRTGNQVPDFTLTTYEGQSVQLSELRGKTVLINFWASWCLTCQDEAAMLETVWREVEPAGNVVFLGIDYADTEREARAYIKENSITYTNGADLRSAISNLFHISGVPETYVIDKGGNLTGIKIGPFSTADEIRVLLEQ